VTSPARSIWPSRMATKTEADTSRAVKAQESAAAAKAAKVRG